jgi:hypothetical protein
VVLPSGSHLWFPGIPADCSPWPSAGGYLVSIAKYNRGEPLTAEGSERRAKGEVKGE